MRQQKPIKKDYDVWIYPITFDYDMLLRFKQVSIKHKREKKFIHYFFISVNIKKKVIGVINWVQ